MLGLRFGVGQISAASHDVRCHLFIRVGLSGSRAALITRVCIKSDREDLAGMMASPANSKQQAANGRVIASCCYLDDDCDDLSAATTHDDDGSNWVVLLG